MEQRDHKSLRFLFSKKNTPSKRIPGEVKFEMVK